MTGANVSFFAFQDIITSVTGILLLLVIFLILQLEVPGLLPIENPVPEISLDELKKRIAEGIQKIREVEEVKIKAGGESEEKLIAQIADLKAGLSAKPENSEDKDIKVQVETTKKEIEGITKVVTDFTAKKSELEGEAEKVRGLVEAKANGLADAQNSSQIWLHKGTSTQEPILLDVREDKAILRDFSDPDIAEEMTGADMVSGFNRLVQRSSKESSYFVFFVRPKAIGSFKALRTLAIDAGFSVGYNPIDEGTEINIAPE